ncbi:MAG: helix-turn-helix domain-containing protein [Oscillospiraceae bacterium]|nr:helix-turn-helix domain-containing protein [Oscillospiraceae bacterium]
MMTNKQFSQNLRQLRLQKALTQEQLAKHLGVSAQSVSRWECGTTLPDVLLLPQIARLYGITVDDLYRDEPKGYPSYAQRLLAVYEASGRTEDFFAAEQAFERMPEEERTADDLRSWGVLYHYMTTHCGRLAQKKLEEAMAHPMVTDQVYNSAAQQKIALLGDLGRGEEEARRYDQLLAKSPEDPRLWLLCVAAHEFSGDTQGALEIAREGLSRFPEYPALYVHASDLCRSLKRYDEAFDHWRKALDLDRSYLDAVYSMGFCYQELGQFDRAHHIWTALTQELDRRGLVVDREYPAKLAAECLNQRT